MSSVDSSLLSGASYLTHNVYSGIFRKFKTSKKENVIVFRISVLFLGICSTLLSLSTYTIYGLWVLAGDLGFVIVFPQFFASVYFPKVPFIYYASTFIAQNLIWLPKFFAKTVFFCQNKRISFSTLYFDEIFILLHQIFIF